MGESVDVKRALECLDGSVECPNGGCVVLRKREDGDGPKVSVEPQPVFIDPPSLKQGDEIPQTWDFVPTDDDVIRLLQDERVVDRRLSEKALEKLRTIRERLKTERPHETAARSEVQELAAMACIRATSRPSYARGLDLYVIADLTPVGLATLEAADRRKADR